MHPSDYCMENPITVQLATKQIKYMVVMQCKVNPKSLKIPKKGAFISEHSGEPEWENDYWIVNCVNDVRPYRILIKEI